MEDDRAREAEKIVNYGRFERSEIQEIEKLPRWALILHFQPIKTLVGIYIF